MLGTRLGIKIDRLFVDLIRLACVNRVISRGVISESDCCV